MLETRVARSSRTGLSVAPHSCVCSSRSRTLALEAVYQVADISACKSMFLYDSRRCMVLVCPRPVYAWGSVSLRHDAGFEMPTGESSDRIDQGLLARQAETRPAQMTSATLLSAWPW